VLHPSKRYLAQLGFIWLAGFVTPPALGELPGGLDQVEVEVNVAETADEEQMIRKRIGESLNEALRSNPKLEPVFLKLDKLTELIAPHLANHEGKVRGVYVLVRAVGGALVTYWGLSYVGIDAWLPKALVAGTYATVSGFWMWNNKFLQSLLTSDKLSISKALGLDPKSFLAELIDNSSKLVRSFGVELTFEGPKRLAIALSSIPEALAGNHVQALARVMGWSTAGQGALELGIAANTKAAIKNNPEAQKAIQLVSDGKVLAISLLTVFSQALIHFGHADAHLIAWPLAAMGVLHFVDSFFSHRIRQLGRGIGSLFGRVGSCVQGLVSFHEINVD